MAATYIAELLHRYIPARFLRSENANNLVMHKTNTTNYGDRSFAAAASKLWNTLPSFLKQTTDTTSFYF